MDQEREVERIGSLTAIEILQHLKEKKVTSQELLSLYLKRANEREALSVNAICLLDEERARERAKRADLDREKGISWGCLHGLPIVVKEINDVQGLPVSLGRMEKKNNISPENSVAVQRLINQGAIIFGKTNLPVDSMDIQSFNPVYGTTSNPYDKSRTCGGSSGGAAAAVALSLSPLELGSDVGGSIRIPAAFCGVFGHKSTYGLVPKRGPNSPKKLNEVSVLGPLARSPEDLAFMLKTLAGPDKEITGNVLQYSLPQPTKKSLKEYKIAVWADQEEWPTDDRVKRGVERVAEDLEKMGVVVSRVARPKFDLNENVRVWRHLLASNGALLNLGRKERNEKEESKLKEREVSLTQYRVAQEKQAEIRAAWRDFFSEYDILLCPSYSSLAFVKDEKPAPDPYADKIVEIVRDGKKKEVGMYRALFWASLTNVGLLPSTTFPVGLTESGLPMGVNAVGKEWDDFITIDFVRLLCQEFGYKFQPPPKFSSARL